jgi:ATP-grasp domain
MMNVLLTGTRAPATLDLARRLHAEGVTVHGVDSMRFPIGRWSKAFAKHHRSPRPLQDREKYIEFILALIEKDGIDLIWPTCEEIFHLSTAWDRLSVKARLFFPKLETLDVLHDKGKFARFVRTLDSREVTSPVTSLAASPPDVRSLIWKPAYSRFGAKTRFDRPPENLAGWIAQERIIGKEFCSYALAVEGCVTMQVFYQAAARLGHGAACAFVPYKDESAAEFVRIIAKKLKFTGQLAFDFIKRDTDGRVFVIECNPRLTSGIHLLGDATKLVPALTGQTIEPVIIGPAQLWIPTRITAPSLASVRLDRIGSAADPAPMVTQILSLAEFAWDAVRHSRKLTEAMTWDIEYDGPG